MTWQERFEAFHSKNPHVYTILVDLAREAKRRGHARMGLELLYCIARWERRFETTDASSSFKINDAYASRYARLIMEQEPDLVEFFPIRRLRSP